MKINPIANRVADGRKRAARAAVLNSIASIPCMVFEKAIEPITDGIARKTESWGGLGVLSESDEHAVSYSEKGFAMVLLDRFMGGSISNSGINNEYGDDTALAQIEPFDADLQGLARLQQIPDWRIENGDILALLINENLFLWYEMVSPSGQTMMANFGEKYMLNKRDDLAYMEPFATFENPDEE